MERMHGVPISQVDRLRDAGVDIPKLARDGVDDLLHPGVPRRLLPCRHAPRQHPGQSIAPETFGRYIALDFGIVGTLTEFDKEYLAQNFIAFFRRDYKRVAELHVESRLGAAGHARRRARRRRSAPSASRTSTGRCKDISLGQVLLRLFQTSRRFNVEIQPQLVLLQKTLLNIEGLGRQLDPELDLWNTAKPFLERWMSEQIGWQRPARAAARRGAALRQAAAAAAAAAARIAWQQGRPRRTTAASCSKRCWPSSGAPTGCWAGRDLARWRRALCWASDALMHGAVVATSVACPEFKLFPAARIRDHSKRPCRDC